MISGVQLPTVNRKFIGILWKVLWSKETYEKGLMVIGNIFYEHVKKSTWHEVELKTIKKKEVELK